MGVPPHYRVPAKELEEAPLPPPGFSSSVVGSASVAHRRARRLATASVPEDAHRSEGAHVFLSEHLRRVEHLRTDGGKEAECGTGSCPGEDDGTVTMSDLARLLGVRPIAFAANGKRSDDRSAEVGSAFIFGAGHCGLASRFASLACSRGLVTRRTPFPSHRSFLAGCECNLRFGFHRWFGFHRSPFSLNGGKLCQANRNRLRPHRATGDSTKHAIYRLATVCDNWAAPCIFSPLV